MSLPPLKRFLGVDEPATDRSVLGLGPGPHDPPAVRAAMQRRLEQIDDHPAARGVDAEAARARVRSAAAKLAPSTPQRPGASSGQSTKRTGPRPVRPGSPEATLRPRRPVLGPPASYRGARSAAAVRVGIRLTPFDQQVLAVLVASRGWNAQARSKLVAMASTHGVSVQGLVKVVNGLSEYAKSGGPRLGVTEITSGRSRMTTPPGIAATPAYRAPSSALMRRIAEQLDAERPGVRLRLAAITALVTILAGILVTWLLLSSGQTTGRSSSAEPPPPRIAGAQDRPAPVRPEAETPSTVVFTAQFDRMPTFLGNGLPAEAAEAADAAPAVIDQLDRLARQLNVDPSLSIQDTREWQHAIRTAGTGWVLVDRSTRLQVEQLLLDAVYAAGDAPSIGDRLLATLTPGAPGVDPLDLWRGSWQAGTLALLAGADTLPPVVVEQARAQVETVFGERDDDVELSFVNGADRWLRDAIDDLVSITEFDDQIEDRWELWIAAQRELGLGERFESAMVDVLEAVLAGPTDLARPGPSANLVGRMILMTRFTGAAETRRRVLGWFDDSRMSVSDLWVLTSLLSLHDRTPWFGNDLVLPLDADPAMRRRVADLIERRWLAAAGPDRRMALPEGRGIAVDAVTLLQWRELRDRLEGRLTSRGHGLVELVATAQLNAAASLLAASRVTDARWSLQEAENALAGEAITAPAVRPGQAIATDGVWSDHYAEAGRNLEQRLARLRALRSGAGTDLGPRDASVLVAEAYRGAPSEVRSVALALIVEYFTTGPTVALELVNQIPDASPNEWLSELITQVTGRTLPPVRSEAWSLAARRALTDHAVRLRVIGGAQTDGLTELVTQAYVVRLEVLGRTLPTLPAGTRAPHEVAEELALHWQRSASQIMARVEVPSDLPGLQRRHVILRRLARGPIQSFVAAQLSLLDLLSYITVAEQPARGAEVSVLLDDSQRRRNGMGHVVEQAVEAERAMAAVWSVRLQSGDEDR